MKKRTKRVELQFTETEYEQLLQ